MLWPIYNVLHNILMPMYTDLRNGCNGSHSSRVAKKSNVSRSCCKGLIRSISFECTFVHFGAALCKEKITHNNIISLSLFCSLEYCMISICCI